MGNNRKVRHHTVPRFYLENFAKNSLIAIHRIGVQKTHISRTSNASVINHFYSFSAEEQERFQIKESEVEDWLAEYVEGPALPVFDKILNGEWPLNFDDRKTLAGFINVQWLRGNDQRKLGIRTHNQIRSSNKDELWKFISRDLDREKREEHFEELWNSIQRGDLDKDYGAGDHNKRILNSVDHDSILRFASRKWCLINFHNNNLITCDAPVAVERIKVKVELNGITRNISPILGPDWPGPIFFPISRQIGLCMLDVSSYQKYNLADMVEGIYDIYLPETEELYNAFYLNVGFNADQQIFCHPDDVDNLP